MIIRPVALNDLQTISELNDHCGLSPWSFDLWLPFVDARRAEFVLGRSDAGSAIAFYLSRWIKSDLELLKLGVHASWRRRGLGGVLMKRCLGRGLLEGCTECYLEVRADDRVAVSFYRKHGFEKIDLRKDYYDSPPSDALILSKPL